METHMGSIRGRRTTAETSGSALRLPPIRNRFKFVFKVHPLRWTWDADDAAEGNDGWLPEVSPFHITPGSGGVGDGDVTDLAFVQLARDGWQVIHPSDPKLGEYREYVQDFPTRGRNKVNASIFESVRMVGNKAIWKGDQEAWRAFRRHLLDSGIVAPIDEAVRESLTDDLALRLDRMRERLASAGGKHPRLERDIERLSAMLDGMQGQATEPKPAPKRRRKAAPKAEPVAEEAST
jgi:hypothetical protein